MLWDGKLADCDISQSNHLATLLPIIHIFPTAIYCHMELAKRKRKSGAALVTADVKPQKIFVNTDLSMFNCMILQTIEINTFSILYFTRSFELSIKMLVLKYEKCMPF